MKNNIIAGVALISLSLILSCENSVTTEMNKVSESETETNSSLDTASYLQKGQKIAKATFKVLSSNLKKAMTNGGVAEAVAFCSVNAQPLTDSLSTYHNVSIKRTSHKIRNTLNEPTASESAAIESFLADNQTPFIEENKNGSVSFYAPIYTKGMCVVCHGKKGSSMLESDYKLILEKYPNDKAINFSIDELRGIWSIIFNPKNNE